MYSVAHWRRLLKKAKPEKKRSKGRKKTRKHSRESLVRPFLWNICGQSRNRRGKSREIVERFLQLRLRSVQDQRMQTISIDIHIAWNLGLIIEMLLSVNDRLARMRKKAIISIWFGILCAKWPGMTRSPIRDDRPCVGKVSSSLAVDLPVDLLDT